MAWPLSWLCRNTSGGCRHEAWKHTGDGAHSGVHCADAGGHHVRQHPFIIVGCMGLAAGAIMGRRSGAGGYALAAIVALAIKIVGYYIFEWMLYGNFLAPLASIPGNLVQVAMGAAMAAPIVAALRRFIPRSRAARA